MSKRACTGCGSTTRKLPHPGPRCRECWKAVSRARSKAQHESHVQRTYGLSEGEYDRLYRFQRGRCALCGIASGRRKRLAVDHDHKTGAVRGILCTDCNRIVLGRLARDSPVFFLRGLAYLEDSPYARMKRAEAKIDGDDRS